MSTWARSWSVVTRCAVTPARRIAVVERGLARVRPASASRRRSSGSLVSTSTCSPVSASSTTTSAEVGQVELDRVDDADDDHLVPVGRASPAPGPSRGSPMKSEITKTRLRRRAVVAASLSIAARSVVDPASSVGDFRRRQGALGSGGCRASRSVCSATGARRDHLLGLVVVEDRADPVAAVRAAAAPGTRPARSAPSPCRARRSLNRIDADRSSTSQAVRSRSSVYFRTNGSSSRAVTFQSMCRTSSSGVYWRRSAKSMPGAVPHRAVRALQPPVEAADDLPLQAPQQPVDGCRTTSAGSWL